MYELAKEERNVHQFFLRSHFMFQSPTVMDIRMSSEQGSILPLTKSIWNRDIRAPILARVEVVIMSACRTKYYWGTGIDLAEFFSRRQVHVGHIPYLGSRVLNCQIDSIINDKDREAFQKVLWSFRNIF